MKRTPKFTASVSHMKRSLLTVAFATLTACSAHATAASPRGDAVEPSQLSAEQVRLVQRSLAANGLGVQATGDFDDRTRSALAGFQRARGIPVTGALDTTTAEALGIDPRDATPVRGLRDEPNVDVEQVHHAG